MGIRGGGGGLKDQGEFADAVRPRIDRDRAFIHTDFVRNHIIGGIHVIGDISELSVHDLEANHVPKDPIGCGDRGGS